MDRVDFFTAAALSGLMSHARMDSPPEGLAAIALKVGKACAAARDADEDAETAPRAKAPAKAAKV